VRFPEEKISERMQQSPRIQIILLRGLNLD
jgi:hypothetical protein